MKDLINKISNKFNETITSANLMVYKNNYKNKSIEELEDVLSEKNAKIKSLENKLKTDNIIKNISIVNKGVDIVLTVAIPGGIPIMMVKKNIEPLKILYYQKLAIREILKEKRKEGKKSMIKEELQYLSENYNPVNYYKFKEFITSKPANVVLENVSIISINEDACSLFNNYTNLNATTMKTEELANIYSDIKDIEKVASKNDSITDGHKDKISSLKNDVFNTISKRLSGIDSIANMYHADLQLASLCMPVEKKLLDRCRLGTGDCLTESIETISSYLRESFHKPNRAPQLFSYILPLTNTLILTESIDNADILKTPSVLRKNLIEEIKHDKSHLMSYKYILNESCNNLSNLDNSYTRSLCKLRDDVNNLCEGLIKARVMEIGNELNIDYEEVTPELLRYKVIESLYTFSFDDTENFDIMAEQLTNFIKDYNEYTVACEAVNKKKGSRSLVWKAGHAVEKKTQKILNNGRDSYDTNHRNTTPIKKSADNIEKLVNYPINQLISIDKEERRKRLVEGRFRLRIWKLIRKGLITGAISVVAGPIIAAIGFIGSFAVDKALDRKVKGQILHEMETELKLVEEKIDDAKGDRKDKEKYQLMRIKAKLEKEIDRIKFGLGSKY